MKLLKFTLIILVVLLSSCKTKEDEIPVDCLITPEHESCVVDCEVTPLHTDCLPEVVDCEVTPEHRVCDKDEIILEVDSCEEQGIDDCLFTLKEAELGGTFKDIASYKTLSDADQIIEENDNPNLVVFWDNKIVNMKYGVIDFNTKPSTATTSLTHVDFRFPTYLNGSYNREGLFLDSEGIFTQGMVQGVHFELLTNEVKLIPYIHAQNVYSYYYIENNELYRKISLNASSPNFYNFGAVDQAPEYLEEGVKYYSYDHHYFYTDIITMTDDYRNDTRENSVNSDNPYYNYYQYLSFRSKTNYTAEELNTYINSKTSSTSVLRDSGQDFINAQNDVFINAAMEMSFAIHESGWGTSQIARDKKNVFGINAVDSDAYNAATGFESIEECVKYHSEYFLGQRYFNPTYFVAFGTNVGNKYQGINYKYASDAYWGEKIAKHYYNLDKALGFKDYNAYKIVILDTEAIGYYGPSSTSKVIYNSSEYNFYGLEIPYVLVYETDEFYVLRLPIGLNNEYEMDPNETLEIADVFYVPKEYGTIIN